MPLTNKFSFVLFSGVYYSCGLIRAIETSRSLFVLGWKKSTSNWITFVFRLRRHDARGRSSSLTNIRATNCVLSFYSDFQSSKISFDVVIILIFFFLSLSCIYLNRDAWISTVSTIFAICARLSFRHSLDFIPRDTTYKWSTHFFTFPNRSRHLGHCVPTLLSTLKVCSVCRNTFFATHPSKTKNTSSKFQDWSHERATVQENMRSRSSTRLFNYERLVG